MEYHGRNKNELLYVNEDFGVVVDESTNLVLSVDERDALVASAHWDATEEPEGVANELAKAAITELDITVLSDSDRMYTIPNSVVAEAKRGLKWRAEENRGGTPVGLNNARTLARGGQVGIKKVRHIAKYFPRHEVDKKAKGYKTSEEGYPSNGRIAWALWGGDAAQKWASTIVERENAKKKNASLTAGLYEEFYGDERIDYNSFSSDGAQPDFYIRINLRNGDIDRLYMIDSAETCKVWDDGYWEDMGSVEYDFAAYDKDLDDDDDKDEKAYVLVDRESAIAISAILDTSPMQPTDLASINVEETELFEAAMGEMDWASMDQFNDETVDYLDEISQIEEDYEEDENALMASVSEFAEGDAAPDSTPGVDTPEEKSERAATQVRDMFGRFAQTGSRVIIAGNNDYQGVITAQDAAKESVSVLLDNGETVSVAGKSTQEISTFEPVSTANFPANNLDFTGILGEPRVPIDQPNAKLPGRLPPLTAKDVNTLVTDWSSYVADQRVAPEYSGDPVPPIKYKEVPDINTALGKYYKGAINPDGSAKSGWNPATAENVYNEPLLRDWLDEKYGNKSGVGQGQSYAGGWYQGKTYSGVDIDKKESRDEVVGQENRNSLDKKFDPMNFSVTAAGEMKKTKLTPETSDVAPMYLAIVADDDPQAVMELVCLVPASTTTIQPSAFVRKPGKWERDDSIIADLNSPTPPPVIVLDNENLADVTLQIDGDQATVASVNVPVRAHFAHTNNQIISALMAAGGADRNRGNAEGLRRYWTIGKGGLKIRWGTPGDWTRCNRQLKKYMGPRAKGYCALRHKEMNGVWPGDKRNVGKKKGKALKASANYSSDKEMQSLRSESKIVEMSELRARALSAKSRMLGRSSAMPKEHGAKFVIPLVIPEGIETGDGRVFEDGAISMRELPLPLLWQIKTGSGHDGSVVVGQITYMEKVAGGIGNAIGVFDTGEYGQEAERLVRHGFIRGVSADMDKFEADEEQVPEATGDDSEKIGSGRINITNARVMAVTIVPKPAFQECFIQIVENVSDVEEETMQPDGIYVDNVNALDASALVACGMVADAIPMHPLSAWFGDQKLRQATPLTILDDGRVFGHIAAWNIDHIGMNFGVKPPRSRSKYSYFHTGTVKTAEGDDVSVGQLTLSGGHAGLEADATAAMRHYDDTASAFADVHAGEDAYGIWVSGALRPGTTPDMIRAARASAPSGDWRPIRGSLELVAVCQVNVPGFPIARSRVASGQVMALVAAGASVLAQLKSDPIAELNAKIDALSAQLNNSGEVLEDPRARFAAMKDDIKKDSEKGESWEYMIQMLDDDPENELAIVSRRVRKRLAREGKALPDGSFPIRNVSDLRNAVQAYGRAKSGKRGIVAKHIIIRARALNRPDLVPPKWSTQYSADGSELSLRDRTLSARTALADVKADTLRSKTELAAKSGDLEALFLNEGITAAAGDEDDIKDLTPEEIQVVKQEGRNREEDDSVPKLTPDTQPRDSQGKFRQVLARLKQNLGSSGLDNAIKKVEEAENLDNAGDYEKAAKSADDLIGIIDRLDAKALNPEALENIRNSSAELGRTIANLPFDFGMEAQKIRYSDVPAPLQNLMEEMISKVEDKIGDEDAAIATADLKRFMAGGDYFNQSEISSQMSKLLRLLT
jgi:tetratricopeptide (TPR) repeat protein